MIVNARGLSLLAALLVLVGCGQMPGRDVVEDKALARADACLQLEQGWVRAPMPGRDMTAGYGRVRNRCEQSVSLDYLHSDAAAKVELHRTEIIDGVSRMRAEVAPQVPAGGVLELAPGGLHLMLHGVGDGVVDGAELSLSLGRSAEDALGVQLTVRGAAPQGAAGSQADHAHDGPH